MDAVLLSRIQFGLSIGFHYLYPQTTLGLAFLILLIEARRLGRGADPAWDRISAFTVRIFSVIFAFGVATGLIMPFSIGMHWGAFSMLAAPVFGTQLAIESMTAFTLEAAFLAILVFGRERVGKRLYFASALLVFLGSHLSAFIIVSAQSWMQTPAGYVMEGGRAVLTDWLAATFNPSVGTRFLHAITAAWLSGLFLFLALTALQLRKGRNVPDARKAFALAAACALVLSLAQPLIGHQQIMDVLRNQPVKDAAYEGIFESQNGAPLIGFGIPDAKNRRIRFALGIPKGLSFLETFNPNSYVKGLNDYPEASWPPVNVIFTTFHIMVPLSGVIVAVAALGWLWGRKGAKKALEERRGFLLAVALATPAPYLANTLGWIGAEIGRQPWVVYGLLKTVDGTTPSQSAAAPLFSLLAFALLYVLLAVLTVRFVASVARRGIPAAAAADPAGPTGGAAAEEEA